MELLYIELGKDRQNKPEKRQSLARDDLWPLLASERWEYPADAYSRLDFASPPTSSFLGVAKPFTNKVEKGWKKCTDPMVGGARSITLYDASTPSSVSQS